jgi:hypothetical protein
MRIALALMCAPVAVAVALAVASPAGAEAAPCPSHGAKIVLRKDSVVVYTRGSATFSCSLVNGRRAELADDSLSFIYPPRVMAVRGTLLAFVALDQEPDDIVATVSVIDTSRVRDAYSDTVTGADIGYRKVGSLVLTARGSIAWVACPVARAQRATPAPECVKPGRAAAVWSLARGARRPRLLDGSGRIDPRSLRLSGGLVSWVRDGRLRSAPLR